jgi:PAS domain S-box-containing protein
VRAPFEQPADEIKRLQRCINDLVSVLALPAMWTGGEPSQVVSTLLDALMGMLRLDLICVRLNGPIGEKTPFEMVRSAPALNLTVQPRQLGELLDQWLGDDPAKWAPQLRNRVGDADISLVPLRMGLQGEIGVIVAGARRADFPEQTERLVLSVAANQAAIGLQGAGLLSEQRHLASELDRRVVERTNRLAEAENNFRHIVDSFPGLVCTMSPAGVTELINRPLMDYFGKTFEELKNWTLGDAVHPDDLPREISAFTHSITTGTPFNSEVRLRRVDGVYRWFQNSGHPVRETDGRITGWYFLLTDIDDRKRAEEALRASERDLSSIINAIPMLAWSARPDGFCEFLNQRWLAFTGLSAEEARGWGWGGSIHPDDAKDLVDRWQAALASGKLADVEARMRRSDGEYRWFLFRASPLLDESGNIVKWYGTNTDIDDRKRTEDELRQSEARKTAILNSALDCIVTIDHRGRITEFNPAAERVFGNRRDEVVGKHLADVIIPPSLRDQHRAGFERYLATGEERVLGRRMELTAMRANGSEFPVELAISRIPIEGPPAFTGYLRDITERKRAEEELRRSEAFLADGQRLNLTGSFLWRLDTDVITFSEQLYRIFDFDRDVPVTLERIGGRVHPEDISLLMEKTERAKAGGNDLDYDIRLRMGDGSIKYLRTIAHLTQDSEGRPEIMGAVQDVTERRLSEEVLAKVRSELAHMTRVTSLGALTASIAHEVNQPLSGIVTNASTCLRMLSADPPNVEGARETARRTIRDGNRASEVITRLRALFGRKGAAIEPVDLSDATREVIALSLSELQGNRVVLRTELADDLPQIMGDRVQLQQVILNLLRNASDAMTGVEDRPRQIVVRTERDEDDRVRTTVRDSGVGIDPHNAERVFEAFYSTKSAGMGMGLSVSKSIIESHHGRLWATPNEGPGTTFSFSLPRVPEGAIGVSNHDVIRTSALTDTQNDMRNP